MRGNTRWLYSALCGSLFAFFHAALDRCAYHVASARVTKGDVGTHVRAPDHTINKEIKREWKEWHGTTNDVRDRQHSVQNNGSNKTICCIVLQVRTKEMDSDSIPMHAWVGERFGEGIRSQTHHINSCTRSDRWMIDESMDELIDDWVLCRGRERQMFRFRVHDGGVGRWHLTMSATISRKWGGWHGSRSLDNNTKATLWKLNGVRMAINGRGRNRNFTRTPYSLAIFSETWVNLSFSHCHVQALIVFVLISLCLLEDAHNSLIRQGVRTWERVRILTHPSTAPQFLWYSFIPSLIARLCWSAM